MVIKLHIPKSYIIVEQVKHTVDDVFLVKDVIGMKMLCPMKFLI